jgi:hypothetical protein
MNALKFADFERFLFAVEPTAFHGEEPQLRFTFQLRATPENTGRNLFQGKHVEFTVKSGLIQLAKVMGSSEESGLRNLKVVSRSEDDRTIAFEDQLGFYRMTLQYTPETGSYLLGINHPNNTYLLEPTFLLG